MKNEDACDVCKRDYKDSNKYSGSKFIWGAFAFCWDCSLEFQNYQLEEFIKNREQKHDRN